jgi:large subunit ribosomal protein L21
MYAVIKSGGKQYKVAPGDRVKLEKIEAAKGASVIFEQVLMIGGDEVKVGSPLVENAAVRGTVESQGRGNKIIVYKFKRRKGYHKKQGHRQDYTMVRIDEVQADAKAAQAAAAAAAADQSDERIEDTGDSGED